MISWIVNGETTQLDDRDSFYLLEHEGFGMPAFHRLEERGPLQHGVTDRGYRLDARTINLVLGVRGDDLYDFYTKRRNILELFRPSDTIGTLRFEQGDIVRQIDGYLIGGLEYSDADREYLFQKTAISIKCPDPTWYDPDMVYLDFTVGGGDDTMEIPLAIPMTVGGSVINSSTGISYAGSVRSFPIINITGPITNCVITNETTGDKLDFTGVTIAGGDTYTIDLRYGYKTVVDSSDVNRISHLTSDSDLSTWCLEPDPTVGGGYNSIRVSGTNATEATSINIRYYEKYIGV